MSRIFTPWTISCVVLVGGGFLCGACGAILRLAPDELPLVASRELHQGATAGMEAGLSAWTIATAILLVEAWRARKVPMRVQSPHATESFNADAERHRSFGRVELRITVVVIALCVALCVLAWHAQRQVDPIGPAMLLTAAAVFTLAALRSRRRSRTLRVIFTSLATLCVLSLVQLCLLLYAV